MPHTSNLSITETVNTKSCVNNQMEKCCWWYLLVVFFGFYPVHLLSLTYFSYQISLLMC